MSIQYLCFRELHCIDTYVLYCCRNLSRDDQRFVDSVTNMGFKRTIVSKAVKRIGRDEKQVSLYA